MYMGAPPRTLLRMRAQHIGRVTAPVPSWACRFCMGNLLIQKCPMIILYTIMQDNHIILCPI